MSFTHTTLSHLSDEEFLAHINGIRRNSPIIDELCYRLEDLLKEKEEENKESLKVAKSQHSICPVCQAKLTIKPNEEQQVYELTLVN